MNLRKEINLNKKFVLVLILINILALSLYYSYALFEVTVIQNNVVVLKTGTINLTLSTNVTNNSFTLASGGEQTINVTLNSTNLNEIGYKMYYTKSGDSTFTVKSPTDFQNNIVEGEMTSSKTFTLTFKNTGANSLTINLFGIGGLAGYPINLEEGQNEIELTPIPVSEKVLAASVKTGTCANKTTKADTDDFGNPMTYISGTKECIDFNYVWYSGKMWRIVAIYNDGSMKLVTDNNITSIAYNYPNTETWFYKTDTGAKSYMYQWLNEDFLDTLVDYNEVIDTTKYWNATMPANTTISTKPAVYNQNEELLSTMIPTSISPVGLLNNYEYYKSYQNASGYSNGYLKIGYYFWLLNPYDASNVWDVRYNGLGSRIGPINLYGARPSIIIKSGISFSDGSGSSDNPYIIITSNKETGKTNEFVNNRLSGEYIKFKSDGNNGNYNTAPLYRIVGTEGEGQNKITKIVAMDFATYDVTDAETGETTTSNTKKFGESGQVVWGTCTTTDCWHGYFNETDSVTGNWTGDWYSSLSFTSKLAKGTYYLGAVPNNDKNYKRAVCSATNFDTTKTIKDCIDAGTIAATWNSGYVGLLRYGEMFATRETTGDVSSIYMWLITPSSALPAWSVYYYGEANLISPTNAGGARPSYYLQSNVKIESGSGLETDPYIID